ncbi:hypothetical protein niasHT_003392 [Heterodera trifolii]|uniref:BTB domain-containing protein n=1 Tax=Heterodera trifolii TaxID=157864 RepID=A0ABD2LNN1_9BILA
MSISELNWIKPMLSTGEYADVHFLIIPAHKFILKLKLASDVFEAMFRFDAQNQNAGNVSVNCPVVVVPDVEAAAFKVMLSFIYAGDLSELNGYNAMAVLYAAKKYNIPALVAPSLQIPVSKLRNVFLAYAQARLFDLEDLSNCCLSYIDKNADTLLKSDEFLQIDQNLLCQILERDELQIPENCRQMVGPALFTIRFPLFSQKEIWETIVPSGVLTADEVIGVEQYHNHTNGINEDIPYTLRFPTHRRFWAFGTITMDIEKVSEFAREEVDSSRLSETVHINGLPWKICAQITKKKESTDNNEKWLSIYLLCIASEKVKNEKSEKFVSDRNKSNGTISMEIEKVLEFAREIIGSERKSETVHIKGFQWKILAEIEKTDESTDNNEKWLGISLLCSAPKEDWNCKSSAIIRIVSQKSGVADLRRELNDDVFDNKTNAWGYNFISFAELMDQSNGFYNREEDKVTLAIDLIEKDEKTEKFIFDQSKSNGTILMEIKKVSEFAREAIKSERKSETVHIKGFPWKILAEISEGMGIIDNVKCLGILLLCDAPKEENWSCKCSAIIRIVSQKSGVTDLRRELNDDVFDNKNGGWGYNFISLVELMDPSKGFYDKGEDKVKLAIDFTVKEVKTEDK